MQVTCIKAFGNAEVGDTAEVPDGATVDPAYWMPADGPPPPAGRHHEASAAVTEPVQAGPPAQDPGGPHWPTPAKEM